MADDETLPCFYCGLDKPRSDFSDEHIWPDALGGDYLPSFWRTGQVCRTCNSISGVFVDGAFIRSWAGAAERSTGAREYLSLNEPSRTVLPLDYLGRLVDAKTAEGEVAEWWAGPCGAHIVHFRPTENEELWKGYVGGDPRAKKSKAGRAYIALASATEYWVISALASFKKHFTRAKRVVVTPGLPPEWTAFQQADRSNPEQTTDIAIMDSMSEAAKAGESVHAQVVIRIDAGDRFLAKLGLAIGCKLFGIGFGSHEHGARLRRAFREANPQRREGIPVRGTGYFGKGEEAPPTAHALAWTGGWILIVQALEGQLLLSVITPSGRQMAVAITDDAGLIEQLDVAHREGLVWLTVPTLGKAAGPLSIADYAAHLTRSVLHPDLSSIEALRIDPAKLPAC